MAKINKAVNWQGGNLNIYKQISRKDISPEAIEHIWSPNEVQQVGTSLDEVFLNNISQNGVYGILDTTKETVDGVERYKINNFEGIEEFGIFEGLKLKIRIFETNEKEAPRLYVSGSGYPLVYLESNTYINIKNKMFEEKQIYDVVFDGTRFIVGNHSLKAGEASRGITKFCTEEERTDSWQGKYINDNEKKAIGINDLDVYDKVLKRLILGRPIGGIFGPELKSVKKDHIYIYVDSEGNSTPYLALTNKEGIISDPSMGTFHNMSVRENLYYKKLEVMIPSMNEVNISGAYLMMNMLIVNAFVGNPSPINAAPLGTEMVNLGTMIPEIANYGCDSNTIAGINLIIKQNFALAKSSSGITFYPGQHFAVITGLYKGSRL